MISRGKIEMPVGVSIVNVAAIWDCPDGRAHPLSQYRRADDAAVAVSQYSVMLSSIWSRLNALVGSPSCSVHAQYFSAIHAAWLRARAGHEPVPEGLRSRALIERVADAPLEHLAHVGERL